MTKCRLYQPPNKCKGGPVYPPPISPKKVGVQTRLDRIAPRVFRILLLPGVFHHGEDPQFQRLDLAVNLVRGVLAAIHGEQVVVDGDVEKTLVFLEVREESGSSRPR